MYYDLLKDAADNKLIVNFHGTTVPRGWSRTFPNLVSMEAIRGFEFTTFDQKDTDLAPKHMCMAAFARNVVGPMDFTPVCFGEIIGKKRRTMNGFEIGLTVVFQSGVQHFVEVPESMTKQPEYVQEYMRNLPRKWDDIKYLAGYPGKYAVFARRAGNKWYIGGINAQKYNQKVLLDLKWLTNSVPEKVTLITDGDTNRTFIQQVVDVDYDKVIIEIKPNGGFALNF
jgi:hypothetical protein